MSQVTIRDNYDRTTYEENGVVKGFSKWMPAADLIYNSTTGAVAFTICNEAGVSTGNSWYYPGILRTVNLYLSGQLSVAGTGSALFWNGVNSTNFVFHDGYEQYEDKNCYANIKTVGPNAAALTAFNTDLLAWQFVDGSTREVYFDLEVPHAALIGNAASTLQFHIHWSPADANAGNVDWVFTWALCPIGVTWPATSTTGTISVATPGVALRHVATDLGAAISLQTVTAPSAIIHGRLQRMGAADTYAGAVWLHSMGVHYKVKKLGTTTVGGYP